MALPDYTPPPSAQMIKIENDFKVEDHIQEGDHDELDLQDVGDWERENPRAQMKHKFVPLSGTATTAPSTYAANIDNLVPVQSVKANPEYFNKIHKLCSDRGVTAAFDFTETAPQYWSGTISFAGQKLSTDTLFPSKSLAKEHLCKLAIPLVEKYNPNVKKRKSFSSGTPPEIVTTEELNSANWCGTLQNFTQGLKLPMPEYTELRTPYTPHLFSCTVKLANNAAVFGFGETLYPTRQAAKKAAARDAVLWVRSRGFVFKEAEITGGPLVKRRKSGEADVKPTSPGVSGLTQVLQGVDVNSNSFAELSLSQQVHEVVASQRFSQPQWKTTPTAGGAFGAAHVDMAAHFSAVDVQREPRLAGEIGKVENVFGKKQAKEQCCKEVLQFLDELKHNRSA